MGCGELSTTSTMPKVANSLIRRLQDSTCKDCSAHKPTTRLSRQRVMPPKPGGERVHVYCRIRPGRDAGTTQASDGQNVTVRQPELRATARGFEFDGAYGPDSDQQGVYDDVGVPILDAVLQGYNGTVLAYGQTGSGKTHTLLNVGDERADAGLVPRLVAALFVHIKCDTRHVYMVKASFAQIYNEQIDDLLKPAGRNLRVKPRGAAHEVEGLAAVECKSASELLGLFDSGRRALVYAETKMNKHSSRSHAVLQLAVSRRERILDSASGTKSRIVSCASGKLTIVDLAGSERVKRSGADEDVTGRRMKEAININSSLLGLSNVMKALSTQAAYVPYRDSKLTHMLSDALGGNCRTSLVVCASPSAADASETLGTLEFGARAMKVRCHAVVNSSEVTLDAAALAADLSEALQLQAEGAAGAQLLAMEQELKERQEQLAALEATAEEEKRLRAGEVSAAIAASETVRLEAARVGEEATSLRQQLQDMIISRDHALAKAVSLQTELEDEATDRKELEAALAVKARELQLAQAAFDEAKEAKEEAALRQAAEEAQAAAEAAASQANDEAQLAREEAGRQETAAAAATTAAAAAEFAASEAAAAAEVRELDVLEQLDAARLEASAARSELATLQEQFALKGAEVEQSLKRQLKTAEVSRNAERLAAAAAVQELDAQMQALLASMNDAEETAAEGLAALHHRLRLATTALVDAEKREAARKAEMADVQSQLLASLDAQQLAVATVEASVEPLQQLVEGLQGRLHADQAESAAKLLALTEAFTALRSEYESALHELHVGEERRLALEQKCEAVETMLSAEARRQGELARSLQSELEAREAELTRALVESSERAGLLSAATAEAAEQAEEIGTLHTQVAEAEVARQGTERKLRRTEAELQSLTAERARLEAELTSIQSLAASEIAEAEAERHAEVRRLLADASEREGVLGRQREALLREKEHTMKMAGADQQRLCAEVDSAASQRRQLWQRLKRQAVVQAASVRQLQRSLSASQAEQAAIRSHAEAEQQTAKAKLALREAELALLRKTSQANEAFHTRRLAASGVVALKHGRKGKPHARHVRCVGERLEWASAPLATKAGGGGAGGLAEPSSLVPPSAPSSIASSLSLAETSGLAAASARQYDKAIKAADIETIRGGLSAEAARRVPKGRYDESLCLCVVGARRSLDLEFGSRGQRDEWWATFRRWHELHTAADMPPDWTSTLPHPPSAVAEPATGRVRPAMLPSAALTPAVGVAMTPPPRQLPPHATGSLPSIIAPSACSISPPPTEGPA